MLMRKVSYPVEEEHIESVLHESLGQSHQVPIECLHLVARRQVAKQQVLVIIITLNDIQLALQVVFHGLERLGLVPPFHI